MGRVGGGGLLEASVVLVRSIDGSGSSGDARGIEILWA